MSDLLAINIAVYYLLIVISRKDIVLGVCDSVMPKPTRSVTKTSSNEENIQFHKYSSNTF